MTDSTPPRRIATIQHGRSLFSPFEVEACLRCHPSVLDVLTLTFAHREHGEVAGVLVVMRKGLTVTLQALRDFARGSLAEIAKS